MQWQVSSVLWQGSPDFTKVGGKGFLIHMTFWYYALTVSFYNFFSCIFGRWTLIWNFGLLYIQRKWNGYKLKWYISHKMFSKGLLAIIMLAPLPHPPLPLLFFLFYSRPPPPVGKFLRTFNHHIPDTNFLHLITKN